METCHTFDLMEWYKIQCHRSFGPLKVPKVNLVDHIMPETSILAKIKRANSTNILHRPQTVVHISQEHGQAVLFCFHELYLGLHSVNNKKTNLKLVRLLILLTVTYSTICNNIFSEATILLLLYLIRLSMVVSYKLYGIYPPNSRVLT